MTNGEKIQTILDVDRDCTEVHGKNGIMTFSVSQDWWNAEYKEPSSSGKPNKSIEEKCPCYYCEHFEIKGLSHCKIHEDAYGDSRCNDYHKINQKPNKSEIPTGSTAKDDLALIHTWGLDEEIRCIMCTNHMKSNRGCDGSCVVNKDMYNAVMDAIEKRIQSTTKNDLGVDLISRADVNRIICEYRDDAAETGSERDLERAYGANAIGALISELPSVTPQKPRCKECKWWKDSDGKYRRGLGAESRCPINSHAVYCGDGYCYMFSPKIDIKEVEK